ncbi:MAG: xanthine dehydrogenase accessory protein XdhC [Shimia sp.]
MLAEAIARHGRVVRVLVADVRGSAPREAGAAMLVWADGTAGTIGGGALEWEAIRIARECTERQVIRQALGPDLGQCCGGAVTLIVEPFDAAPDGPVRAVPLGEGTASLAVERAKRRIATEGPAARIVDDWLVERLVPLARPLWVWGAGHVGRAVVEVMAPLPGFAITWADVSADRFPETEVTTLPAAAPEKLMPHAPPDAAHLVFTYSHTLDLALCDAALRRGFAFCGLIGSETKWARFRKRLGQLGHGEDAIARITCPIGDPTLGRSPAAIAIGVARDLLLWEAERG